MVVAAAFMVSCGGNAQKAAPAEEAAKTHADNHLAEAKGYTDTADADANKYTDDAVSALQTSLEQADNAIKDRLTALEGDFSDGVANEATKVSNALTVTMEDGAMKFCPNGSSDFLYAIGANNGLRIGKEDAGAISFDEANGYLKVRDMKGNDRHIGIYDANGFSTAHFRTYKPTAEGGVDANIANQTLTIYKLTAAQP